MSEKQILSEYLPEGAVDQVYAWIKAHRIHFKITRKRQTKLGDYRPPIRHPNHRISINHDLNPYAFLITFVHELAHLVVYEKYKSNVAPHGKEWKLEYRQLMFPLLENGIFPENLKTVLLASLMNVRASSTSDLKLSRILKQYDSETKGIRLEDLEKGSVFTTGNNQQFQKGDRVRTRYKCFNLQNKKTYLFHPLTPVTPVKI
jgi:hypothetical protein